MAWQFSGDQPVYALDGGVYCAGSAVNWGRTLGLFQAFEEINAFDKPPAIDRNLTFVPALSGLACPHWDRNAVGLWIGMSLDTGPQDMMQAILEGIAFRASEVLGAMGAFTSLGERISVDGGMSVNPYFCQFLADLLERQLSVPAFGELTTLGTAMFACQAPGIGISRTQDHATIYQPAGDLSAGRVKFDEAVLRARNW